MYLYKVNAKVIVNHTRLEQSPEKRETALGSSCPRAQILPQVWYHHNTC